MARTKQTARKSTGGKAPRRSRSLYSNEDKEDQDNNNTVEMEVPEDFLDFSIKEEFCLAENKDQVISKCVPGSPDYHFFSAVKLLADKQAFETNVAAHKKIILSHISALEGNNPPLKGQTHRVTQLKSRLNVILYDYTEDPNEKKTILEYLKSRVGVAAGIPKVAPFTQGSESTTSSTTTQSPEASIDAALVQRLDTTLRNVLGGNAAYSSVFDPLALNWLVGHVVRSAEEGQTTHSKGGDKNSNNNNNEEPTTRGGLRDSEQQSMEEQGEDEEPEEEEDQSDEEMSDGDSLFGEPKKKPVKPTGSISNALNKVVKDILSKASLPPFEGLVDLVVLNLEATKTTKFQQGREAGVQYQFGNIAVRGSLTYDQLLEIKRRCPSIENNSCYIEQVILRVLGNASSLWHPSMEVDVEECSMNLSLFGKAEKEKSSSLFADEDECGADDDEEDDEEEDDSQWRSYTHVPTLPSFLSSTEESNIQDFYPLYFITSEAEKADKNKLMEELWKLASEFIGDDLLNTKAYLMYHVLKYAWHHGEAKVQLPRFVQYLSLPRAHGKNFPYAISTATPPPARVEHGDVVHHPLPPVRSDHSLVRAYLLLFCQQQGEKSIPLFEQCVHPNYLKHCLAEAMITAGPSDEDHTKWYNMLTTNADQYVRSIKGHSGMQSGELSRLKNLKELGFGPSNPILHMPDEEISLHLVMKNIPQVMVQVYEVDVVAFFAIQARSKTFKDIQSDINLDGLQPNFEKKIDFSSVPSTQRHTYTVKFPEIVKGVRGVYVVEVVGGGLSCRTIIRRGFVNFSQKRTPQGQEFTIFDERGRKIQKQTNERLSVTVLATGSVHYAGSDGTIVVPYRTQIVNPPDQTIAITVGNFACLSRFPHYDEKYMLKAGMFIDDEQLNPRAGIVSAGNWSKLVIRPRLYICGAIAPLSLLRNVVLSVTILMEGGVSVTKECKGLQMIVDSEWVYEFQIQRDETRMEYILRAEVPSSHSQTGAEIKMIVISDSFNFPIAFIPNGIAIDEFHLGCESKEISNDKGAQITNLNESSYVLYLLGRGGEPRSAKRVTLQLYHIYLLESFTVELDTDKQGRLQLGPLHGFTSVNAWTGSEGQVSGFFPIRSNGYHSSLLPMKTNSYFNLTCNETCGTLAPYSSPSYVFHGVALRPFHIAWTPVPSVPAQVIREHLSLVSVIPEKKNMRGQASQPTHLKDFFEKVSYRDDLKMLEISGLPAGEYVLMKLYPYLASVIIRIGTLLDAAGAITQEKYLLGVNGDIFLPTQTVPLQITSVQLEPNTKNLLIKTTAKSKKARLHIVFRRFIPRTATPALCLARAPATFPSFFSLSRTFSRLLSTRSTNPEYQYILNRRGLDHQYLGSSLPFPTLLLQPTPHKKVIASFTQQSHSSQAVSGGSSFLILEDSKIRLRNLFVDYSNYVATNAAFLEHASVTVANVPLDEHGVAKIPEKEVSEMMRKYGLINICLIGDNGEEGDSQDTEEIVMSTFWLGTSEIISRDMRLSNSEALNPNDHLCEQRETSVVLPGQELKIQTTANFRMEVYDNLSKVYNLLDTLTNHNMLFAPELKQWPYLPNETKLQILSTAISNDTQLTWATEIYFFIYHKDRPFFTKFVRPYLDCKRDKSFIDLWLLERDLSAFRSLHEFKNLNAPELILLGIRFPEMRSQVASRLSSSLLSPLSKSTAYHKIFNTALMNGGTSGFSENSAKTVNIASISTINFTLFKSPNVDQTESEMEVPRTDKARPHDQKYEHFGPPLQLRETNYYNNKARITVNEFWIDYAKHWERKGENSVFLSPNFLQAVSSFSEIIMAISILDLPFEQPLSSTLSQTISTKPEHTSLAQEGHVLTIRTGLRGGAVIFYKDIKKAKVGDQPVGLVTTQAYFNPREKQNPDGSLKAIKQGEELVVMQVWGCRMSVINTAGCPLPLVSVLLQIPEGAIPLGSEAFYTRNLDLDFAADETETIDYYFYFPAPGSFPHFPLHVACDNEIIARAPPRMLTVAEHPRGVDTSSWDSVHRLGTDIEVVVFLRRAPNLEGLRVDIIGSRLMSKPVAARKEFYAQVISVFRDRMIYNENVWIYGFVTEDERSISELLSMCQKFLNECGPYLQTRLINTKARIPRRDYYEFSPYIHPRVHTTESNDEESDSASSSSNYYPHSRGKGGRGLGKGYNVNSYNNNDSTDRSRTTNTEKKSEAMTEKSTILPKHLNVPYRGLIDQLIFAPRPNRADLTHICFHHLRHNRLAEARKYHAAVSEHMDEQQDVVDDGELRLQIDYIAAYLDLFGDGHTATLSGTHEYAVARRIADKYQDYPILHWRTKFTEIRELFEHATPLTTDGLTQEVLAHGSAEAGGIVQQGGGLHIASARLELDVKGNSLAIAWHPGKVCTEVSKQVLVYYYAMDIEVIFSRDPFANQNRISPHLLVNRPTVESTISLPAPASNTALTTHDTAPYALTVNIPQHLTGTPLVVQLRDPASDLECTRTYLGSSALVAHALQQEGSLRVYEKISRSADAGVHADKRARTESGSPAPTHDLFQPLGGCYVKVFCKSGSGVAFYKDGYTDVAGYFNYVARVGSENQIPSITAFALLVLASNKGAVKLMVSPPM